MGLVSESRKRVVLESSTPPISGLSIREFIGESDFPEMVEVMQRSRDADIYDVVETVDDLANEFRHLQNCDPKEDILILEADGQMIGLCRCEWHDAYGNTRTYNHTAHLVPEWRKAGLRKGMLTSNEMRLRDLASGHDTDRGRFFEARAVFKSNDWKDLLDAQGYHPHSHTFLMTRPLKENIPDLPLPEEFIVRDVEGEHTKMIWEACGEAMREEPSSNEEFWSKDGYEWVCGLRIFRPELWKIAWKEDEIAGGVLNFIDEEENEKFGRNWGYTQGIFVGKKHRNKGLASALISQSLNVLKAQGVDDAALTVDTENPSGALRLYEKMGFRTMTRYASYRKPL
jgi:mycothiol synthase